ncbi:hypothetical protein A2U01_0085209, partial [Trifolium medium]|nr:hypothetical protein [Trifolium medium]
FFCEDRSDNGDGDSGKRAMVAIGTTKVTTAALDFHGGGLSQWFMFVKMSSLEHVHVSF